MGRFNCKKNWNKQFLLKKIGIKNFNKKNLIKIKIKLWKKPLKKNLHARNVTISTESGKKYIFFVSVVLPKIKLWA